MERLTKRINLTEAEKTVLAEARDLLISICEELEGDTLTDYENSEFIMEIYNIDFEF